MFISLALSSEATLGEALKPVLDSVTSMFSTLGPVLIAAVGAIVAAGLSIFAVKIAIPFLKDIFKKVSH